jgi:DNA polymerase sigma
MITLELTNQQAHDILFATSLLYQDYSNISTEYDEYIRRYNNTVDELRQTIKEQIKEQDPHEN